MYKMALSLILVSCLALLLCLGLFLVCYGLQGNSSVAGLKTVPSTSPPLSPTLHPTFTPAPMPTFVPSPMLTRIPSVPISTSSARIPASSPPTRIVAPAIGLDAKVVEVGWETVEKEGRLVTVWEAANYAAGFHKSSAYPGCGGNIVISGHHNIKGEVFRYAVDLEPGDEVLLYVGEVEYRYIVEKNFILREEGVSEEQRRENAKWIGPFPDERLTLVTCWPYTGRTHRVIVIAKPAA